MGLWVFGGSTGLGNRVHIFWRLARTSRNIWKLVLLWQFATLGLASRGHLQIATCRFVADTLSHCQCGLPSFLPSCTTDYFQNSCMLSIVNSALRRKPKNKQSTHIYVWASGPHRGNSARRVACISGSNNSCATHGKAKGSFRNFIKHVLEIVWT